MDEKKIFHLVDEAKKYSQEWVCPFAFWLIFMTMDRTGGTEHGYIQFPKDGKRQSVLPVLSSDQWVTF